MKNPKVLWAVSLSLVVGLGCVSENQSSRPSNSGESEPLQVFGPENISFDKSLPAISNAQKFILPIPSIAGEPLVYPEGVNKRKDNTGNSNLSVANPFRLAKETDRKRRHRVLRCKRPIVASGY